MFIYQQNKRLLKIQIDLIFFLNTVCQIVENLTYQMAALILQTTQPTLHV